MIQKVLGLVLLTAMLAAVSVSAQEPPTTTLPDVAVARDLLSYSN